jgi:hypothetical protein
MYEASTSVLSWEERAHAASHELVVHCLSESGIGALVILLDLSIEYGDSLKKLKIRTGRTRKRYLTGSDSARR